MKNILLWIKERIRLTFSDIFSFSAKASGGDFFTMFILNFIITWIITGIVGVVFTSLVLLLPESWQDNLSLTGSLHYITQTGGVIFIAVAIILFLYLQLANICRRLNDLGRDRWLAFLIFIPGLNILFELYLIFMPGKDK